MGDAPPDAPPAAPPAAPQAAAGGAAGMFTADSIAAALNNVNRPVTPTDRMLAEPQLVQLIAMARQNPSLVGPLLEELSRSAPQLLQLVQANQTDFMALLNGDQALPTAAAPPAVPPAGAAAGGPPPGGGVQIQVTAEERAAIERLEALGFERDAVLQAFMACDKDENLAANLLFDGM